MDPMSLAYGCGLQDLDVLVVDDALTMRRLITEVLRAFGVKTIHQAHDGQEALELLDVLRVNLIISDWEMRPMGGARFLGELRKQGREPFCFTPVIVLTAYGRKSLVEEAFCAGASQYLLKPIVPVELLKRIERVLQDRRPFRLIGGTYRQDMPFFTIGQDKGTQDMPDPSPVGSLTEAPPDLDHSKTEAQTEKWVID